MSGFGLSFGRLIREKRGIEALTQDALAAQSGLTKARISELENGRIAKPHARTVDALCVALNITREERAACHDQAGPSLPPLLLENLALRFGHTNPDALEEELLAFLKEKARELSEMKQRLAAMDAVDGAIAVLVREASAALDKGEFQIADTKLAEAEAAQLSATTLPALQSQHRLRFERGHAALLAGEVQIAADHWEAAASYFHFFDPRLETDCRYEASIVQREFAYRYRSADALLAAERALRKCLQTWTKEADFSNWCKALNSLGGVYWRLSQFDDPSRFRSHLLSAKDAYAEVRESCSAEKLPYYYAISGGNLANIYSDRAYAASDEEFADNLTLSLKLQLSAVATIDRSSQPTDWGIFHHNLGCTYTKLFGVQANPACSLELIDQAIQHLDLSFEVRDPVESLQYWVASSRSLAEALIARSVHCDDAKAMDDLQRAIRVLAEARSRISKPEHPHQWASIEEQAQRLAEELVKHRNAGGEGRWGERNLVALHYSSNCEDYYKRDRQIPSRRS